jgi:hypothetical protein
MKKTSNPLIMDWRSTRSWKATVGTGEQVGVLSCMSIRLGGAAAHRINPFTFFSSVSAPTNGTALAIENAQTARLKVASFVVRLEVSSVVMGSRSIIVRSHGPVGMLMQMDDPAPDACPKSPTGRGPSTRVLSTGVYERLLDTRWTAKPIFKLSI